ncbi:MAG: hypothetical protein ACI8WB_001011 [Phenylobacterium sp.]|jgi:hypothetical protein
MFFSLVLTVQFAKCDFAGGMQYLGRMSHSKGLIDDLVFTARKRSIQYAYMLLDIYAHLLQQTVCILIV